MFFVLSKVLWVVTTPGNLVVLALVAGLGLFGLGQPRWGGGFVAAAAAVLVLCGVLPTGNALLRLLEDRFPPPAIEGLHPAGIIVLGGSIDQIVGAARGQVTITDAATRITAGAVLARRYPDVKLVFTGGSNALLQKVGSEAEEARRLWIDLGVPAAQIVVETLSRNTEENARFSSDLLHPEPGRPWLLVTSAYHMPRAVGLFRAAGFPVVPFPVDYRTTGTWHDFAPNRDAAGGLDRFDTVLREWIGLVAYRLTGRIDTLFPGP